jgi:hypothetical protein
MGILSSLFGDSKNANKIVDGAISGLDKSFFTAEERSEAGAKMADWYLRYLEASQPQNVARRFIALIVVGLWSFLIVFSVAVYRLDQELSEYAFDTMTDVVANPFMMIMGFYFATHVVRAWQGGKPDG